MESSRNLQIIHIKELLIHCLTTKPRLLLLSALTQVLYIHQSLRFYPCLTVICDPCDLVSRRLCQTAVRVLKANLKPAVIDVPCTHDRAARRILDLCPIVLGTANLFLERSYLRNRKI